MNPNTLPQLRVILAFFQPFCGAVILMCFYLWLRGRQVRDQSLVWLSLSLLTSSFPAAIMLIGWKGQYMQQVAALCSPATTILYIITAFQLLRIREAVRRLNLQRGQKLMLWVVSISSFAALLLIRSGERGSIPFNIGINLDAVASCIALITLGICMSYSFYKYGNQPLIFLTLLDFTYLCWYQLDVAARGGDLRENVVLIAVNITSVSIMTMLFIALTLAWGLSNTSRLRFKDYEPIEAIVMFVDLRESTKWLQKVSKGGGNSYGINFLNKFSEWTHSHASAAPYGIPNVKSIGDAFMFVWEIPDNSTIINRANAVVGLGSALYSGYQSWVESTPELYKELMLRRQDLGF